ncbi:hypothetical protein ACTA71_012607 [Dictyostelium dimigraforme]
MVSGELSDRQSVREKPILARLKLIIGAGTASMTPPLGPNLGQYGINSIEFFNDFNTETKELFDTEYYKNEVEAAKGGNVYIEKDKLLKDCFKIAILICTFNKEEKQWETIDKKYLRIKVKTNEILNCFTTEGPIFIGQLLSINGSEYNNLRQYAIEHNGRFVQNVNSNQVKMLFGNIQPLVINNTMLIVKAATIEEFNKAIDFLKQYAAQILPLNILLPESEPITENEKVIQLKDKKNIQKIYYRFLRDEQYVEVVKQMKQIQVQEKEKKEFIKEDALKAFTKMDRHARGGKKKRKTLLTGYPQKKGFCVRVYETKPKKPNSAIRKVAKVTIKLKNKKKNLIAYIPGFGPHNLQQLSTVLIRGGRCQDLPGVKYRLIRKQYDFQMGERYPRSNRRSKFSVKNEKRVAKKGTAVKIG